MTSEVIVEWEGVHIPATITDLWHKRIHYSLLRVCIVILRVSSLVVGPVTWRLASGVHLVQHEVIT